MNSEEIKTSNKNDFETLNEQTYFESVEHDEKNQNIIKHIKKYMEDSRHSGPTKKMDTFFFNSLKKAKDKYYPKFILDCLFKILILGIFWSIDKLALKSENEYIFSFMALSIGANLISIAIYTYLYHREYSHNEQNVHGFLTIAAQLRHATNENIEWSQGFEWENVVDSNIYKWNADHSEEDLTNLTNEEKEIQENRMAMFIHSEKTYSVRWYSSVISFMITALVIYGIVTLATRSPSKVEIIVLSIYLFLEAFNTPIIFILISILLLPFIICCCCIASCTGMFSGTSIDDVVVPEAEEATIRHIELSSGSCSICLQNITTGEKILTLPCDEKHIFHETCITTWLRVSQTCPMCRSGLPQKV